MTNKEVYKIWAPSNKKWVDWVRPVPFIEINDKTSSLVSIDVLLPFLSDYQIDTTNTAIIVDLQGTDSVEAGIVLVEHGYRPIPIFNGVAEQKGSRATTDNHSITNALLWGAIILSKKEIKDNAPPAFLIDTNRLQRQRIDNSIFDNSWDVYHQDLPSEQYFLDNGITKILVISETLSRDLKAIFSQYPKKKIEILLTDGYKKPRCVRKAK